MHGTVARIPKMDGNGGFFSSKGPSSPYAVSFGDLANQPRVGNGPVVLGVSAPPPPPPPPAAADAPFCFSFCSVPRGMGSSNSSVSSAEDNGSSSMLSAIMPRSRSQAQAAPPDKTVLEMEKRVVQEMNSLSVQERERVLEEVHGVDRPFDESDFAADVQPKLDEMQLVIDEIPPKKKTAYLRALFMSPAFVKNIHYRLMFLRSVRYEVSVAAKKFVTYFEHKKILFGEEKIVKRITWDDLGPNDQAALKTGFIQYLPRTDQSGRGLVVIVEKFNALISPMSQLRATWYMYMSVVDSDVEVQKKGIITIMHNCGSSFFDTFDPRRTNQGPNLTNSLPAYPPAVHYCYSDIRMRPAINLLQILIQKHSRVRFRAHYGSHTECKYKLISYGIPISTLPFDDEGNIHTKNLELFLRERRQIEAGWARSAASSSLVAYPRPQDVLLGRGRPYHDHPGNVHLSNLIDQYRPQHANLRHGRKGELASQIVHTIKATTGARFLKRCENEDDGWYEVAEPAAREKVHHGFRGKPRQQPASSWKRPASLLPIQPRAAVPLAAPLTPLTTDFALLQQQDAGRGATQ